MDVKLEDIIAKHGCKTVIFGDDTQLYLTCNSDSSVSVIESCVEEFRDWMKRNFLALDDTKTEVICFTLKYYSKNNHLSVQNVRIGDVNIGKSDVVRNLGFFFFFLSCLYDQLCPEC